MTADLLWEIVNASFYGKNKTLGSTFSLIYGLLLIGLGIAVILYFNYFIRQDSHETRTNLPIALLIASVTNFLLALWIIIYFTTIYKSDKVYLNRWDQGTHDYDDPEDEILHSKDYRKQSKGMYVIYHIIWPLLYGMAFLLFFFVTRDWVKRHEK